VIADGNPMKKYGMPSADRRSIIAAVSARISASVRPAEISACCTARSMTCLR
jgi:hypothetical protein